MRTALDYFLELIYFETTSDENSTTYPSSPGQIEILRHLVGLVEELGLRRLSDNIRSTVACPPFSRAGRSAAAGHRSRRYIASRLR